jgi:hypothetical protein
MVSMATTVRKNSLAKTICVANSKSHGFAPASIKRLLKACLAKRPAREIKSGGAGVGVLSKWAA